MSENRPPPIAPAEAFQSYDHLFRSADADAVGTQADAVWSDVPAMTARMDRAVKDIQLFAAKTAVEQLKIRRKRDSNDAFIRFGGMWINGYVLTRVIYGTALANLHYSGNADEANQNGQRIIEFSESIGIDCIFPLVPDEVMHTEEPEAIRLSHKYGERAVVAAAVTSYGYGITAGIAEQSLFNDLS